MPSLLERLVALLMTAFRSPFFCASAFNTVGFLPYTRNFQDLVMGYCMRLVQMAFDMLIVLFSCAGMQHRSRLPFFVRRDRGKRRSPLGLILERVRSPYTT